MSTENFKEIVRRLGLKTVEVEHIGGCFLVVDPRIPRRWRRERPCSGCVPAHVRAALLTKHADEFREPAARPAVDWSCAGADRGVYDPASFLRTPAGTFASARVGVGDLVWQELASTPDESLVAVAVSGDHRAGVAGAVSGHQKPTDAARTWKHGLSFCALLDPDANTDAHRRFEDSFRRGTIDLWAAGTWTRTPGLVWSPYGRDGQTYCLTIHSIPHDRLRALADDPGARIVIPGRSWTLTAEQRAALRRLLDATKDDRAREDYLDSLKLR
jgi:hypothetical protein